MMGAFLAFLAFLAGGFVVAWLFVPGFRDRVRGMTAAMVGALGGLGVAFAKVKGWL